MEKQMKVHDFTLMGILIALAITLSAVEWLLPPLIPSLPGARLGLANVLILFCLYVVDFRKALTIAAIRSVAVTLFMRGMAALIYSLAGGLTSLIAMWLLKRICGRISVIGISIVGAVTFNIAQLMVGAVAIASWHILNYLPMMTLFSLVSGLITGVIAKYLIKHFEKLGVRNGK